MPRLLSCPLPTLLHRVVAVAGVMVVAAVVVVVCCPPCRLDFLGFGRSHQMLFPRKDWPLAVTMTCHRGGSGCGGDCLYQEIVVVVVVVVVVVAVAAMTRTKRTTTRRRGHRVVDPLVMSATAQSNSHSHQGNTRFGAATAGGGVGGGEGGGRGFLGCSGVLLPAPAPALAVVGVFELCGGGGRTWCVGRAVGPAGCPSRFRRVGVARLTGHV